MGCGKKTLIRKLLLVVVVQHLTPNMDLLGHYQTLLIDANVDLGLHQSLNTPEIGVNPNR